MSAAEIKTIRAAAKQDGVWSKWPEEMAKKAIIKRASKQWPKTDREDRLDKAVAVLNEYEGSQELTAQPIEQPAKPAALLSPITDERLQKALIKIKAGEYTIQKLEDNFELTELEKKKMFHLAIKKTKNYFYKIFMKKRKYYLAKKYYLLWYSKVFNI
jgi:recombinational DNA repair protein RecT